MSLPGETILLVEDNEDDVFIFRRALEEAEVGNPLRIAAHSKQAVDYLAGKGEYGDRTRHPLPFIVFLDLKLPYIDGFDVLRWMRRQPQLESIVAVVLTSSDEERDHSTAYELGARSYVIKPPDADQVRNLFRSLEPYWDRYEAKSAELRRTTPPPSGDSAGFRR